MLPQKMDSSEYDLWLRRCYYCHPDIPGATGADKHRLAPAEREELAASFARTKLTAFQRQAAAQLLQAEDYPFEENWKSYPNDRTDDFVDVAQLFSTLERIIRNGVENIAPADLDLCLRVVRHGRGFGLEHQVVKLFKDVLSNLVEDENLDAEILKRDSILKPLHDIDYTREQDLKRRLRNNQMPWAATRFRLNENLGFRSGSEFVELGRSFIDEAELVVRGLGFNGIEDFLAEIEGKTVLDLGSGTGILAKLACMKSSTAKFINVNPGFVDPTGKAAFYERFETLFAGVDLSHRDAFAEIDDQTLIDYAHNLENVGSSTIDLVLASASLPKYTYSRSELKESLDEIMRVLKSGGEAIFYPILPMTRDKLMDNNSNCNVDIFVDQARACNFEIADQREIRGLSKTGKDKMVVVLRKP